MILYSLRVFLQLQHLSIVIEQVFHLHRGFCHTYNFVVAIDDLAFATDEDALSLLQEDSLCNASFFDEAVKDEANVRLCRNL